MIKLDLNDVEEDIILYISSDSIKPVCYSFTQSLNLSTI
jgi:hypothetical protein